MKKTDKNIIMVTAGGTGQRFGSDVPKQYNFINGKLVIEYVLDVCKKSEIADSVLVVAAKEYHDLIKKKYGVDVADAGDDLNHSKRNGFDFIRANSTCEKLVVVESVRPTITPEVIDLTFQILDNYDCVACARKITDSLGCYNKWVVNREEYYTLNPPEGFKFELLDKCFSADSLYTESIQQLPSDSKVFLNFDVPYFEKITYPEDLDRIGLSLQ